jgi:hypothetical protein
MELHFAAITQWSFQRLDATLLFRGFPVRIRKKEEVNGDVMG